MKIDEAYEILELSRSATPEEAKKRYREFTKKYHPDVNKDPGAEDRFKKINEAYQIVSTGKSTEPEERFEQPFNPFDNFQEIFSNFNRNPKVNPIQNIHLDINISFKESVLGVKRDIKFKRDIKCKTCNGNGEFTLDNGCKNCGGKGVVINKSHGMVSTQTCMKCFGRAKKQDCKNCDGNGYNESDTSISVKIPAGVKNESVLRLNGVGNFISPQVFGDAYSSVFLNIIVENDPVLRLEDLNVVCDLEISLLDALKGCKHNIKTIFGDKEISINPLSKNNDKVLIPDHGVNNSNNQIVILSVKYPDNTDDIIKILEK